MLVLPPSSHRTKTSSCLSPGLSVIRNTLSILNCCWPGFLYLQQKALLTNPATPLNTTVCLCVCKSPEWSSCFSSYPASIQMIIWKREFGHVSSLLKMFPWLTGILWIKHPTSLQNLALPPFPTSSRHTLPSLSRLQPSQALFSSLVLHIMEPISPVQKAFLAHLCLANSCIPFRSQPSCCFLREAFSGLSD